jgi:O-antigen/teichoic acid export membrane protein
MASGMALANFFANLADFFQRKLFVDARPVPAASVDFIRFGLQIALLTAFALWLPAALTVNSALLILAFSSLTAMLFAASLFGRPGWRRAFARAIWPRHYQMSRWLVPGAILTALQGPGIVLFASLFFAESLIGGLRAMHNVSNLLLLPMRAMQNVAESNAARVFHQQGRAALGATQRYLSWRLGLFAGALTLGAFFLREPIVTLVIGEYVPLFGTLFVLYCLGNVSASIQYAFSVGLKSMERTRTLFANSVITTVLSLTLFLSLQAVMGIASVPVSRIIALLASCGLLIRAFVRAGTDLGASERRRPDPSKAPGNEAVG